MLFRRSFPCGLLLSIGGTHYLAFYSGKAPDTAVLVSVVPAPE